MNYTPVHDGYRVERDNDPEQISCFPVMLVEVLNEIKFYKKYAGFHSVL